MYIYNPDYDEETGESLGMKRAGVPMFPFFPTFGWRIHF
jgi:hypothetical protein